MNDLTRQSLLARAGSGDGLAWKEFASIYEPFIGRWLQRTGVQAQEVDDLTQEVLVTLVKELPRFKPSGQPGAFRAWLRKTTVRKALGFHRSRKGKPQAPGGDAAHAALAQLEDPDSDLTRQFDADHNAHVLQRLFRLVEGDFAGTTAEAFRLVAVEGKKAKEVAASLGMTPAAVHVAKARVLQRLREEGAGLLD
jgi:RNA polymerase sigma-70 factor (ECF subfamily)